MTSRAATAKPTPATPGAEANPRGASLTDGLFARFEAQIRAGVLAPGARLPSQKEIALAENVSRTVVREAFARLAAQGLTTSRQGSGAFVADTAEYRAFQITRDELNELADVIKLLEMRLAVETEMAGLAAARRTAADLAAIQGALDAMVAADADPVAAARADAGFHLAIARATQNDYYARLVDFLGLRLVPPRNLYLRDQSAEAHRLYAARVREEHDAIVEAIARQDAPAAREAARRHMQESLNRHSMLSAAAQVSDGAD